MDCLGLTGSTPTMPPPPNVGPLPRGLPVVLIGLPLASTEPAPELGSVPVPVVPGTVGFVLLVGVENSPGPCGPGVFPGGVAPAMPLGPIPANAPQPVPLSGWPKKPIAIGVLFWQNMIGFQSSFPVIGSMYFLRRKRISLVLTSASRLGG